MVKRISVHGLANDLASRLRWDMETGALGYPKAIETDPQGAMSTPSQGKEDPKMELETLREEIGDCSRCDLHRDRTNLVFGEGAANASLVFVGEGPGRDEDRLGRPFVGAAGKLLDRIMEAMGTKRSEVYICNIVKCRPPNNRNPDEEEQGICGAFARKQIDIICPKIVVALGNTAAQYLTGKRESMGRLRGRFHEVDGLRILPTYHPAYLLRNPSAKRPVWEDMQLVMAELGLQSENGNDGQ